MLKDTDVNSSILHDKSIIKSSTVVEATEPTEEITTLKKENQLLKELNTTRTEKNKLLEQNKQTSGTGK